MHLIAQSNLYLDARWIYFEYAATNESTAQ